MGRTKEVGPDVPNRPIEASRIPSDAEVGKVGDESFAEYAVRLIKRAHQELENFRDSERVEVE